MAHVHSYVQPGLSRTESSDYPHQGLSPSPEGPEGDSTKHRRNYQACEGCRNRKVKCDLGPVDQPHLPPCARCRRENKTCIFADTRKKRNQSPSTNDLHDGPATKRSRTVSNSLDEPRSFTPPDATYNNPFEPPDITANIHHGSFIHPQQSSTPPIVGTPHRPFLPSPSSRSMPRSMEQFPMQQGSKKDTGEVKSRATETIADTLVTNYSALSALANVANNLSTEDRTDLRSNQRASAKLADKQAYSGASHRNRDGSMLDETQMSEYRHTLEIWSRMTFVRAGFFTAEEAIAYVDYFYDNLQSMTPVIVPDYRDISKHLELLTKEPILALTILTIASRYKALDGFSAVSRQYTIHEHLWRSLTSKVQRLLWGQEQFGGGGGTAKVRELAGGQLTWTGSLRTLGTIEALLLLTDWQPRSLHFPPGNDDIRLLDKNFDDANEDGPHINAAQPMAGGHDKSSYSSWLEPAWRSDRMSWMLLGLAEALSFELGVFDEGQGRTYHNDPDLFRNQRIRRMVTVYVAQTSGRIGIPSPLDFEADYIGDRLEGDHVEPVDIMHGLWTHIAGIMHQANKQIFPSREFTMQLTRSTQYREAIATFAPQLELWKEHFHRVEKKLDPVMQCILLMEYEYARLYINSIGLQHVVESWVRPGGNDPQSTSSMAKSVSDNKKYIDAFTEAALNILDLVSGRMQKLGVLRDAPVRTFLRTLSAMMFTLKRLSMGNHERMVRKSIDLLERVTKLLTIEVVDDVHLSASTARMIEGILNKVKQTMIRVQKPVNTSGQPSREHSRATSPQRQAQHDNNHEQHHRFDNHTQSFLNGLPTSTTGFDPLAGIEARPMAALMDKTFIPPPNYNFETNDFDAHLMDDTGIDRSVNSEQLADWFTLPLDSITNKDGFRVDQGFHGIGPMVGQHDMLEMITQTQFDQNAMQWPGHEQLYQGF